MNSVRIQSTFGGQCIRTFSTTRMRPSNIGSARIPVPETVTVTMNPPPIPKLARDFKPSFRHQPLGGPSVKESDAITVTVQGPLGKLELPVPPFVSLVPAWTLDATLARQCSELESQGKPAPARKDIAVVVSKSTDRKQREMWGTTRAILNNCIKGVSKGHVTTLTLKGVGYRGAIVDEGKRLELKVGHNHSVYAEIPEGIIVTMTNPTIFEVTSTDKEKLGIFCANVRKFRPPEPYKGKVFLCVTLLTHREYLWAQRQSKLEKSRRSSIALISTCIYCLYYRLHNN
jgi:large subunit ribosomal protein L6